ncbi:hypothetical protein [Salinisphaera orenii]|uniref:hypothetical protein n=1 Tax=Salinisphaera orenii TaxID=856731 RepID=UPI0013A67C82
MQNHRTNNVQFHTSQILALGLALLVCSMSAWAGSNSDVPSMSGNDNSQSMQQRGFFGSVGHYLANNTYASLGYLRFDYIGDSNNLQVNGELAQALAGGASVPNSGSTISDEETVGATLGIFIPKTAHHLSLEFGLAPPIDFAFQISGAGQDIGSKPPAQLVTGGPIGRKIGTFKTLPPTLRWYSAPSPRP